MPDTTSLRMLLVDDDAAVARGYQRILTQRGARLTVASNGREAVECVKKETFDVIVSDISMPEMSGIDFLKSIRNYDLDVPVILLTGNPTVESAAAAVEYGAFRYFAKPVLPDKLWETVLHASRLHSLARLKAEALELPGRPGKQLGERAALEIRFSWGMKLMWMAYQPIVSWRERGVYGYEALLRSEEPLMKNPAEMLEAAERLGLLPDLGRAVRAKVAADASVLASSEAKLFVNLHSADLNDENLFAADAPLTALASRVVLEVTERASLHGVKNLPASVARLKRLGFHIAIDDLGAGYAGLTSFTQLDPTVAKLDMSLIRNVDTDVRRQTIVRSMRILCEELGILVVAEGVETAAERDTLVELGCDLFQGYLFAKPGRGFEPPKL